MRAWAQLRFVVLAGAMGAASACQRPTPAANTASQATESAPDVNATLTARWKAIFTHPDQVREAANSFGYRVGPYAAAAGGGYRMVGVAQTLPDPRSPTHITTGFSAHGAAAGRIDRIEFTFDVVRPVDQHRPKREREALQIPRRAVQGFLARFEVGPSDAIKRALQDFTSATDTMFAGRVAVVSRPDGGGRYHIVVTITPA